MSMQPRVSEFALAAPLELALLELRNAAGPTWLSRVVDSLSTLSRSRAARRHYEHFSRMPEAALRDLGLSRTDLPRVLFEAQVRRR